jgi:hypothetical protein
VANTWVWWVASVATIPMLAAPLLVTIRRSSGRRVRFFGRPSVHVPGWAHLLGLGGIVLGLVAAEQLGGREDDQLYAGGVLIASLVLGTGLLLRHNRHVAADSSGAREGVRTKPPASG